MPESMEMYPGTSGKTQGERNETSPARKAAARGTSFIPVQSSMPGVNTMTPRNQVDLKTALLILPQIGLVHTLTTSPAKVDKNRTSQFRFRVTTTNDVRVSGKHQLHPLDGQNEERKQPENCQRINDS